MRLDMPNARTFALTQVSIPTVNIEAPVGAALEGLTRADILISDGKVVDIVPVGTAPADLPQMDLRYGMVLPCFTDMHTHIDKGHIWPRQPNPDGTFTGALQAVRADTVAHWSANDVETRMEFSLNCAYAHGTQLLRTHIDSAAPQHRISFEVFAKLRARWQGRIALQAAALFPLDAIFDDSYFNDLLRVLVEHQGLLGGVTQMGPDLIAQLDRVFSSAKAHNLDIDLHVDETAAQEARTLEVIAEASLRHKFKGSVTVGHCCSLAQQSDADIRSIIAKVADAGLQVVSLPMCNMYLQDRHPRRTPRWRGVTLFHELAAAGVATAVASDNTRDPFYAYGDLDPVEVIRESVRILHLDHPFDDVARIVTTSPAAMLKRPEFGRITKGAPANMVLFSARNWSEFFSRPQSDRAVMRSGKLIAASLPDYRDLDTLFGAENGRL